MRNKLLFLALAVTTCISAVFADNYPARMYLIGDGAPQNNWDLTAITSMVTTSPGVYTWTGELKDGRMKFIPYPSYEPSYGPTAADTIETGKSELAQDIVAGESYDMELRVDNTMPDKSCNITAGRYKLTLDITGDTPRLTVEDGTGLADNPTVPIANPGYLYPIGDATEAGWDLNKTAPIAETEFNSGIYTTLIKLKSGSLKFLLRNAYERMYGATIADQPVNEMGEYTVAYSDGTPDNKFRINYPSTVNYKLTINLNTNTMTIYPEKIYIIGPAMTGIENDWNFFEDKTMHSTETDGVYSWTGELYNGQMKFFTSNDFGSIAYGATTADVPLAEGTLDIKRIAGSDDDYKFKVSAEQTGNYTLTLDLNNMKLNAIKNNGGETTANNSLEQEISWNITDNHIVCTGADQIEVLAISGTRIASCQGGQLDISNLHAGIYIAILHKNGQKAIHKFIVR